MISLLSSLGEEIASLCNRPTEKWKEERGIIFRNYKMKKSLEAIQDASTCPATKEQNKEDINNKQKRIDAIE